MPSLKPAESTHLRRIVLMAVLFAIPFALILARYYYLQIVAHEFYAQKSQFLHSRKATKITQLRGTIYSSMGTPLASSRYRESVYLAPSFFKGDDRTMRRAALLFGRTLGINPQTLQTKMEKNRDFVLKRNIDDEKITNLRDICMELDVKAAILPKLLYQIKEARRDYPQGELAAHVVGLTQRDAHGDNIGLSGAEATYNADIAGQMVDMDEGEERLTPEEAQQKAAGNDVHLTIHDAIQEYTQSALKSQVEKFQAKSGVCVVMEVGTGAILAMASYPDFDLNNPTASPKTSQANRCLMYAISPGSVMKVFTSAALLENGKLNPNETVDCHGGSISFQVGRNETRKIKDSHELGVVTVMKAFAESSNVAYTILGQR
ncbi:TPA: hypothetical protein DDW35_06755, partial [Candidatus Sumerlaeota bacterium]|nr:hypothetical protein [Candidatus Sumerlaeota bacterium]